MRIYISQLYEDRESFGGREISVSGWVRTNRASGKFGFLELSDGSCFGTLQIVYEEAFLQNYSEVSKLTAASGVTVRGILELTPDGRQPFELKAREIVLEAGSAGDYPLQKKRHSLEFLREIAHLRPRANTFLAVFRIRSLAAYAVHEFFRKKGFLYVNTPILTGSDAEGAGEMFRVTTLGPGQGKNDCSDDFFRKRAALSVSGQLEAEAYALAFGGVYTFGPAFRAEDSNTSRHMAEFWMIEPEIAFADIHGAMNLAEEMIRYVINYVLENAEMEYDFLDKRISKGIRERLRSIADADFARVSYTEAVDLLGRADRKFDYPVEWGMDLQTEHERYLSEEAFKKPVFVTDYPEKIKAFYMRRNDDGKTVAAFDLLVPGIGELTGGSQREERYDLLREKIRLMGMDESSYDWYLDLRKYGGVKHAGFGTGFERLVMYLTGMTNIRDVIPFPRTPGSLEF